MKQSRPKLLVLPVLWQLVAGATISVRQQDLDSDTTVKLSVPSSAPANASQVDPNFPNFAFELASTVEYARSKSTLNTTYSICLMKSA